ncbi:PIG-L family deacetylase [Candidatus Dojkabacteria bacterium]|uniref:PIG-L family deacetylase n=1 Tax=Candidatus Dojkabacteria bacterium TaxID=2099670 RepID=A0A955L5U5_9BACT|nr:PIG-L family deacetylase [Candidatus Dojkabacteria bacterium]
MDKVIVGITAHPDDHVVFAGTIFKLKEKGFKYYEIVLTGSSEGGDYRKNTVQDTDQIHDMRMHELSDAAEFLGVEEVYRFDEEDQNLTYSKELMHRIIPILRKLKPQIVIGMNEDDVHPDHIAANQLTREALRWAAKSFRAEYGEAHRTPIALFAEGTEPIKPHLLVDVTDYYEQKENLFKKYLSQASPKDLDLLKSSALIRGYHLRKKDGMYAEAFSTEKNILPILFDTDFV